MHSSRTLSIEVISMEFNTCLLDLCLMSGFSMSGHVIAEKWLYPACFHSNHSCTTKQQLIQIHSFTPICMCFSYTAADGLYTYVLLPVC